jgi:tRNA A-37 threonylcarbamoyl transferase component Bud32
MRCLSINPRYRDMLARHGLACGERLVALTGPIVTGHPGRNVARVAVGSLTAYLKREHRVLWRDRLRNAAAGFGFTSLAVREARTLKALKAAGGACPDWIAAGEDDRGRAFLLLGALPGAVDLQQFLRDRRAAAAAERYHFARALGTALAHIHQAGFGHRDLYAKHVLVTAATGHCYFLDWQRARHRRHLAWRHRARDLAALDATLAGGVATARERLACLRAYLQVCLPLSVGHEQAVRDVRRAANRLLRHRHVRQERETPPPVAGQGILWLDGEALCVTQEFWKELGGIIPDWLPLPAGGRGTSGSTVTLPGGRRGFLVRRWCNRPLAWLWGACRRRPLLSPELRDAGAFFRRRKHGQTGPRVLAFGQRRPKPWRTESFLLTEIEDAEGPA